MKKILIVEDEPDIQELLEAYLREAGYETVVAGDGVEALSLFQTQPFDMKPLWQRTAWKHCRCFRSGPLTWCFWMCCFRKSTGSACVR